MDEEVVKPRIQDRIRSFIIHIRIENIFIIFIVILIIILGILAYFIPPDELIINPIFKTRTELFLTTAIGLFALLEGVSTALQLNDNRKRNKIIDLRNELENVYGPLFTLLSYYTEVLEAIGEPGMTLNMGSELNEIFRKYPHVLSSKLYDYWKENINTQTPRITGENEYYVNTQFVADFFDEYEEKVTSYRKLVDKE